MGQEIDRIRFCEQDFARFGKRLHDEVADFGRIARAGGLSSHGFVIGFEVEAWLVDHGLVPAPINESYLAALADPLVVPELSRFNVELNGTPLALGRDAFSALERELSRTWRHCLDVSHAMDDALRRLLMPAMLTRSVGAVRQDRLCYLMERLPLPA